MYLLCFTTYSDCRSDVVKAAGGAVTAQFGASVLTDSVCERLSWQIPFVNVCPNGSRL
jgi:hypothetical protein